LGYKYDLDQKGNIIYSKGKYIIKLSKDGQEDIVYKCELATKIKA
jgi:hypothetical protein